MVLVNHTRISCSEHYLYNTTHPEPEETKMARKLTEPFLAAYGPIAQHFRPRRHRFSAAAYRREMRQRFASWQAIIALPTAA
jgi:putative transposase